MLNQIKLVLKAFFLTVLLTNVLSAQAQSEPATLVTEEVEQIRRVLTLTQPEMGIVSISASPVSGLYEVNLENGQALYASRDAKYFIPGDLYQASPQGLVNLGEQRRNAFRAEQIASLDESDMLVFDVIGERKATLTVFTDVDCPYCRKLHAEVPELNAMGIAVRYLAYPRTGLDTETYFKMVSTWCSDDPKAAFTSAKRGGAVDIASCDNPVAEHYQMGRLVGVTGTPALVLEDGSILPGYVPAATLASYMLGTR